MNKQYILGAINILLIIVLYLLNLLAFINLDIYNKNIIVIISIFFIVVISILIHSYLSKNRNIYNVIQFISFLLNIILIFNINNIENTYEYYSNIYTNKYVYKEYSIYVQKKNTTYNNIIKLKDKNISFISDSKSLEKFINDKKINTKKYTSIKELEDSISNGTSQALLLNKEEYNNLSSKAKEKIKVIYTSKIQIEKK